MPVQIAEINYYKYFRNTTATKYEIKELWRRTLESSTHRKLSIEIQPAVNIGEPTARVASLREESLGYEPRTGTHMKRTVEEEVVVYVGDEINTIGMLTGRNGKSLFQITYSPKQHERVRV